MARMFNHNNANYMSRSAVNLGLNGVTECSLCFWVSLENVDAVNAMRVWSKDNATQQTIDVLFDNMNNGSVLVRLENPTLVEAPQWAMTIGMALRTWTRVLFTFKRNLVTSADGNIYVNGASVATTFSGAYTAAFTLEENSNTVVLGNRSALNAPMSGALAWVNIWNRQLTAQEAVDDYWNPRAVTSGLVSSVELCPDDDLILGGSMTVNGTLACASMGAIDTMDLSSFPKPVEALR